MLRRLGFGLLFAAIAFVAAAALGYAVIDAASSNTHDRSMEAAMTGAFVFGPIGAIVGFIGACICGGRPVVPTREEG